MEKYEIEKVDLQEGYSSCWKWRITYNKKEVAYILNGNTKRARTLVAAANKGLEKDFNWKFTPTGWKKVVKK